MRLPLLFLAVLALSSSFAFSQNKVNMEEVYIAVAMYDQIFLDAGIDVKDGEEFNILQMAAEMDALARAGLDITIPFKAAGMDSTKTMVALTNFGVAINLRNAGFDWKASLAVLDHVKDQNVDLTRITENDRTAVAFQCGLKAGGQSVDIEKIQQAIKLAQALNNANVIPNSAYKALGIDVDLIPVNNTKYQVLLEKIKKGGVPWAQLLQGQRR